MSHRFVITFKTNLSNMTQFLTTQNTTKNFLFSNAIHNFYTALLYEQFVPGPKNQELVLWPLIH